MQAGMARLSGDHLVALPSISDERRQAGSRADHQPRRLRNRFARLQTSRSAASSSSTPLAAAAKSLTTARVEPELGADRTAVDDPCKLVICARCQTSVRRRQAARVMASCTPPAPPSAEKTRAARRADRDSRRRRSARQGGCQRPSCRVPTSSKVLVPPTSPARIMFVGFELDCSGIIEPITKVVTPPTARSSRHLLRPHHRGALRPDPH